MADDRDDVSRRGERPAYTLYRSKPRGLRERLRGEDEGLAELGAGGSDRRDGSTPPRRRGLRLRTLRVPGARTARRLTVGRVVRWLLAAVAGWLLLSLLLFLVSAQLQRGKVSDEAKAA